MEIANVRLGLATNSSSSHSIVILPEGMEGLAPKPNSYGDLQFGWEHFVLRDEEMKKNYLAAMLFDQLVESIGEPLARITINELLGVEIDPDLDTLDVSVDHQSQIRMPLAAGRGYPDAEFIEDFVRFVEREDVMILGGNDNTETPDDFRPFLEHQIPYLPRDTRDVVYSRKSGDWWTIFNSESGAKVRLSFEEHPRKMKRAHVPELVDMKITDYCPYGCPFCYQDSTKDGKHADLETVKEYIRDFSVAGVFEIAIGGGEPTLHPDFPAILKYAGEHNVVPNFTTFTLPQNWNLDVREAVFAHAGAFAVSVQSAKDVKALSMAREMINKKRDIWVKVVAHFVVGAFPANVFDEVVKQCAKEHISLTLLGYKTTGRGGDCPIHEQSINVEEITGRVSVDTAFLAEYKELLDQAGIHPQLYVEGEGRFSMYVDAVEKTAAISSYEEERVEYSPSGWRDEKLIRAWREIAQQL